MNKNFLYSTAILLASLTLGACGSDDNDTPSDNNTPVETNYTVETVSQAPTWQVDWSGNEARPDWQAPNPSDFENWTVMLVELENALKPYATKDDLMAFFVGDELRGLTQPAINVSKNETDACLYVMKVYGNEASQEQLKVTIKYYCSQLKQTFSRSDDIQYNVEEVYGIDESLIPQFTLGSSKYPVVTPLVIAAADLPAIDVPFAASDMLATFVGNECRGTHTFDQDHLSMPVTMPVFGRQEREVYTLKYYNAASQRVYTFSKPF